MNTTINLFTGLITAGFIFAACGKSRPQASLNDYVIGKYKAYLFIASDGRVNYEKCSSVGTIQGQKPDCKLERKLPSKSQHDYIVAVARTLGVDSVAIRDGHTLAEKESKLQENIEYYKEMLASETDVEASMKIKERIKLYGSNAVNFRKVSELLSPLYSSDELKLDESIHSTKLGILTKPFQGSGSDSLAEGAGPVMTSPLTGQLYAVYQNICWYDAHGVNREYGCKNLTAEVWEDSRKFKVWTFGQGTSTPEIKPSCRQTYGSAFFVQKMDAFQLMKNHSTWDISSIKSYKNRPARLVSSPYANAKEYSEIKIVHDENSQAWVGDFEGQNFYKLYTLDYLNEKTSNSNYICAAPAKLADPEGDIDSDGIPNSEDQCNTLFNDDRGTLDVNITSKRYGCFNGPVNQKHDSELSWLKDSVSSNVGLSPTQ